MTTPRLRPRSRNTRQLPRCRRSRRPRRPRETRLSRACCDVPRPRLLPNARKCAARAPSRPARGSTRRASRQSRGSDDPAAHLRPRRRTWSRRSRRHELLSTRAQTRVKPSRATLSSTTWNGTPKSTSPAIVISPATPLNASKNKIFPSPAPRANASRCASGPPLLSLVHVPVPALLPLMRVGMRMPVPALLPLMRVGMRMPVPVPRNEKFPPAHAGANCFCCVAIIRPTAIAAPKPLSMFTTVMPDAQLVSIANKAVKPASAVP